MVALKGCGGPIKVLPLTYWKVGKSENGQGTEQPILREPCSEQRVCISIESSEHKLFYKVYELNKLKK